MPCKHHLDLINDLQYFIDDHQVTRSPMNNSLRQFLHNLPIHTSIQLLDETSLGSPVRQSGNLCLERSTSATRWTQKDIKYPVKFETVVKKQNEKKKKQLQLIQQKIVKVIEKNEQKTKCRLNRIKSLVHPPIIDDMIQSVDKQMWISTKSVQIQPLIKQKIQKLAKNVEEDQQNFKKVQDKYNKRVQRIKSLKDKIQMTKIQQNTTRKENKERENAIKDLQKKKIDLQKQINRKQQQKEQILQCFPCLKVEFETKTNIKEYYYMSQRKKIQILNQMYQRLKEGDRLKILQKKLQDSFCLLQQRLRQLQKKQTRNKVLKKKQIDVRMNQREMNSMENNN